MTTEEMYRQIAQKLIEASRLSGIPFEVYIEYIDILLEENKNGKSHEECEKIAHEFFDKRKAVATPIATAAQE